jgi:hypothetical protein
MQGTNGIAFENCGRRFYLRDFRGDNLPDTVSGRGQNWIDVDGSASGLDEPTLIVSGLTSVASWLEIDSDGEFGWFVAIYLFAPQQHFIRQSCLMHRDRFDSSARTTARNEVWDIFECRGMKVSRVKLGIPCAAMEAISHALPSDPSATRVCQAQDCH